MMLQQNMKRIFLKKRILIYIFFLGNSLLAQVQNNEILYIGDNSSVYLSSNTYYFGTAGQTKTTRTASTYGKLIFSPTTTWSGASDTHFVDGYATTKATTAFVLPIGQAGIYAPAQVISTTNDGVDGAYFRTNPNTIATTLDASVKAISSIEYWDIRGAVANAKISLTWRTSSNITNLSLFEGTSIPSLSNVSLVGFDGTKWVLIPSTIDATSILGGTSTLSNGSITSDAVVNLNAYSAFSLGAKQSSCELTTTWDGTSWNPFVPVANQKAIIAGNYSEAVDINACSLEITGTAVVSIPSGYTVNVSGAVTVANTASLTFENNANLIQQGTTNTNSGNVIVKRDSSPLKLYDYTLWSSPVANQNLSTFSPQTAAARFYTYNTSTNLYNAVNPSTTNFANANGYLIRMPANHPTSPTIWHGSFTGVPNNGDIPYTMTDGGAGFRFNLVGNPYPSPINMAQFVTDNTNITGTLYFWRKTNNPLSPSYCSWTAGTFTTNGEAQVVNPAGIIQTGQGFIVEANGTGTNLVFNNNQRVANNTGQFFKTKQTVENNRIWLNATNTLGAFSQMAVGYSTGATQGVDSFDGKYYNDGAIALNSILNNTDYVIQGRALPFDATDVVPMSFSAKTAGDYTIAIDHVDGLFAGNQDIILVDNATGIETDLKTTSYTFSTSAGMDTTRFSLKYQKTLGINNPSFDENNVTVFKNKGTISIKSSMESISNVKVFDINGRLLFEKSKVNANETSIDSSKFAKQVLIVKITSENNKVVNKKVIN